MTAATAGDYVVARTFAAGEPVWELLSYGERPSAAHLRQLRRPGRRVRAFTGAQWDALPYGQQAGDWVYAFGERHPRDADGVRR
jgi:hypothetical protein